MKERLLRFRIWNGNINKWIYGPNNEINLFGEMILFGEFMSGINLEELDNCHALQYSGLKDKIGREIYDGDIIKGALDGYSRIRIYEVIFKDGSFEIKNKSTYNFCLSDVNNPEVIGNIFDNPELLK